MLDVALTVAYLAAGVLAFTLAGALALLAAARVFFNDPAPRAHLLDGEMIPTARLVLLADVVPIERARARREARGGAA